MRGKRERWGQRGMAREVEREGGRERREGEFEMIQTGADRQRGRERHRQTEKERQKQC